MLKPAAGKCCTLSKRLFEYDRVDSAPLHAGSFLVSVQSMAVWLLLMPDRAPWVWQSAFVPVAAGRVPSSDRVRLVPQCLQSCMEACMCVKCVDARLHMNF